MLRLLLASVATSCMATGAFAADPLSLEPAPALAAPLAAYDWSGFYLSQQVGWGWAGFGIDDGIAIDEEIDLDGAFFGGILGAQMQWDWFVLGAEVEANWSDIDGKTTGPGFPGTLYGNVEIFGSAAAKAGIAWDRFLVYGTGGFAGAEAGTEQRVGPASSEDHEAHFGWMAGGGIDFAVTQNVIVGAQYRHYDLGEADYEPGFFTDRTGDLTIDTVSGHLTVKFGGL